MYRLITSLSVHMPPTSLDTCDDLVSLRCSLDRERLRTIEEAAEGSRFRELRHDEKTLVACMSKELEQYDHYLHALKDAAFLNRFITMVQTFVQKKSRELYLQLSQVVGGAFCNCLEDFLFHLRHVYHQHDQLLGYLRTQSFRSWAVGTARNPTHKYRELFRYQFPACDFNHPLVLRNPDLWVDNAAKMFYTLVDLYTKFKCTTAYALSCNQLLWLGKRVETGVGVLRSSCDALGERLWLGRCARFSPTGAPCASGACPQYNAVWFPQFHMYVQFRCIQTLCKSDLFVTWAETFNCTDALRQQALLERCAACGDQGVEYELFIRPTVDWNLFCPFKMGVSYTQSDGCPCPVDNTEAHTETGGGVVEVSCVREDYLFTLCQRTPIRVGTYVHTTFKTCNVSLEYWKAPLDQLVRFYKCVVDTLDMQLLQTESQTKQLGSVVDCIQKNVAMYQDLVGSYVEVDCLLAQNKIRKLEELLQTVEGLLGNEPLTVVAQSKSSGKQHVIRELPRARRRGGSPQYDAAARHTTVDYDSDVSDG